MPTYIMECQKCGYSEEWFNIKISTYEERTKSKKCKECGEDEFQQTISKAPPVFYKGSGWSVGINSQSGTSIERNDAALRENDQLQHIEKTKAGIERVDQLKRAEDRIEEEREEEN